MTVSSTAQGEPPRKGAISRVAARARDAPLLDWALRRLATAPSDQQATVRAYHDAALRRATIADQLIDERGALGTRARFVRVRSNSFVALTELEVC